jgi:uncharacterized protein (TIGR03437 family)
MSGSITNLVVLAFSCIAANAAALVPVPKMPQPSFPVAGLEVNQGQANAGILFLSPTSAGSIGVTAQSVLFSPLGATLNFVASNPNPSVSFSDPLSGLANSYTGADPAKWFTGIPRYATATLTTIYPGIDAQYVVNTTGVFLNVMLAAGANLNAVQFAIPQATSIGAGSDGLTAIFGADRDVAPELIFSAPAASQTGPFGQMNRNASFIVQSTTGFALAVEGIDPTLPLQIAIQLSAPPYAAPPYVADSTQQAADAAGNTYYVIPVADAAGRAAPFPTLGSPACGTEIATPIPCTDVAVYKYSAAGTLEFITYLAGAVNDTPSFLGLTPDGQVAVAGTTDSADFPVTAGAFQNTYAGPPPTASDDPNYPEGDLFAAILDSATGRLQSATFLGSPSPDTFGAAAVGPDGSLYFLPAPTAQASAGMPVSSSALLAACPGSPCYNGYAARLSPALDRLIYGTYLPGMLQATAQLYSDGSVYYAGTAEAGFSATLGAYQTQNVGGSDGIVARLDPFGSKLLFATYYGGPETDWILSIALAPDGSVWANVNSFMQCCINSPLQLIHLDASGSRLLAAVPIYADPMVVDSAGNLIALAQGSIEVSPDAILGGSCGGPAYVKLSPTGQQLFATYLPGAYQIGFDGADANGDPYIDIPSGRVQVVENQAAPPNVGCVVDAASFSYFEKPQVSPGGIVTIFGAGIGPSQGVSFQLVNGQVSSRLAGTQVMVNGEAAPLLYTSNGQVNLIVPYDLVPDTTATIQVVTNGTPLNPISNVQIVPADITLFQVNGAAAALNQDYTVNSPNNPAQPGSTVMLFGTGGGQTSPASTAGEVTPLGLRPLVTTPQAAIISISQMPALNVEYAGAAPALVSGVTQINVTLPATIPLADGYPPGTLPLQVADSPIVTIYATAPFTPTPSVAGAP